MLNIFEIEDVCFVGIYILHKSVKANEGENNVLFAGYRDIFV